MGRQMTAQQLITAAAACTVCGKIHKARKVSDYRTTYAAADGHAYSTRIYELTGRSGGVLAALQQIVSEGR
jgi:hypothetical protein